MGHVVLRECLRIVAEGRLRPAVVLQLVVDRIQVGVQVLLPHPQLDDLGEALRRLGEVVGRHAGVGVVGLEVGQGQHLPEGRVVTQALLHHRLRQQRRGLGSRVADGGLVYSHQRSAVPVEIPQGDVAPARQSGGLRLVQGAEESRLRRHIVLLSQIDLPLDVLRHIGAGTLAHKVLQHPARLVNPAQTAQAHSIVPQVVRRQLAPLGKALRGLLILPQLELGRCYGQTGAHVLPVTGDRRRAEVDALLPPAVEVEGIGLLPVRVHPVGVEAAGLLQDGHSALVVRGVEGAGL